jgi:NADH-quinone oxidoreductase subunit C
MQDRIFKTLKEHFPEAILSFEMHYDFPVYEVAHQEIANIISFLKNDSSTQFGFLTTLCGVHYPEKPGQELCVMYQLHNLIDNNRIRLKTFLSIDRPQLPSITHIFKAANWQERETYDFFGIEFIGHPNLKRILNMDEMNYFPLRKEYPLEDLQRDDKNDALFGRTPNITKN